MNYDIGHPMSHHHHLSMSLIKAVHHFPAMWEANVVHVHNGGGYLLIYLLVCLCGVYTPNTHILTYAYDR